MDHRKAIILSINLCSSEFTQTGSEESQALQDRLSQMNARWDRVCSLLEEWRGLLQGALMQCQVRGALGRLCSQSHVSGGVESVTWFTKVTRGMRLLPRVNILVRSRCAQTFYLSRECVHVNSSSEQSDPTFCPANERLFPQVHLGPTTPSSTHSWLSLIQQTFTEHIRRQFLNIKVSITNTYSYHTGPVSLFDRHCTKQSRYTTASLVGENRQ